MKMNRVVESGVAAVLGTWVVGTALSQHPSRTFDRLRVLDKPGTLIPNWRFFAPEPATHDYRVLHRVRTPDTDVGPWTESVTIPRRKVTQAFWFPERRRDKAVHDLCSEIIILLAEQKTHIPTYPCYRLLRDHIGQIVTRSTPDALGFQWVVARTSGYDSDEEPTYLFASPYEQV